jgi:hypothetical protein
VTVRNERLPGGDAYWHTASIRRAKSVEASDNVRWLERRTPTVRVLAPRFPCGLRACRLAATENGILASDVHTVLPSISPSRRFWQTASWVVTLAIGGLCRDGTSVESTLQWREASRACAFAMGFFVASVRVVAFSPSLARAPYRRRCAYVLGPLAPISPFLGPPAVRRRLGYAPPDCFRHARGTELGHGADSRPRLHAGVEAQSGYQTGRVIRGH